MLKKLTQIRKIKFTQKGILATTNLLSENFELEINLIKSDIIENFDFITLNNAYNSYWPLKKTNFDDIKSLLKYVLIHKNVKFYSILFYSNSDLKVSKSE